MLRIKKIELPENLTSIGTSAFKGSGLSSIRLNDELKSIGASSFMSCYNLQSAIIGKSVDNIGTDAFSGCNSLIEVFCLPTKRPEGLSEGTFSGCHDALEIYVPDAEEYGFGMGYISFGADKYQYSGMSHKIEWTNNLKAYNCSLQSGTTEINAGSYTANIKATYSNGVDFTVEIPYRYEITKAPLSLAVNDVQREYGQDNPAFTCSIFGFVEGEDESTLTSTPSYTCEADRTSNVGEYRIIASLNAPNYEITYDYGTLTVTKAPISIAVSDATRTYGDENPSFNRTYTGLRNGETAPIWTEAPTVTTEAQATSPCGTYTIDIKGGMATNYEIVQYLPGKLTIVKRDLAARATDCERTYGEKNPEFEIVYSNFASFDDEGCLAERPTAYCEANEKSDAGEYPIKVSGGKADNYNITRVRDKKVSKKVGNLANILYLYS